MRFGFCMGLVVMLAVWCGGPVEGTVEEPKMLMASETISATPAQVWAAFTTKEGQESWQVAHADIDLRVGGLMRTHYNKEGRIGDENTINNRILSYDPERMLSIRIDQPPQNFPFKEAAKSVWTVLYFEPVGEKQTRLTVKMFGWTDSDESRKMRDFFAGGNKWVLQKLKEHFEPKTTENTK